LLITPDLGHVATMDEQQRKKLAKKRRKEQEEIELQNDLHRDLKIESLKKDTG